MFDPRSSYHRRMWHYESGTPLSVAQLIALGSLDARTAALLWLLVEHHQSLIVSGPTDPTPGVGKTTTLNALLGFLPNGSTMVYTVGMYEEFEFTNEVPAETTCVLANEVSDHLSIYMWGRVARRLLRLPEQGFAIATSCHADTIADVLSMLTQDLKLPASDVQRLGVIVNIGLVGRFRQQRRRFLTINFVRPAASTRALQTTSTAAVELLPLATWDETTDTFIPATTDVLEELAGILGMTPRDLIAALERRTTLMQALSDGRGVGMQAMREAMQELLDEEQGRAPSDAVEGGDADDVDDEEEEN